MFTIVNTIFIDWLNSTLNEKGWSQAELSKRANISTSMISSVLSGRREPGTNFCNSVAAVLRIPPEDVYRVAGLLPSEPEPEDRTLYEVINSCAYKSASIEMPTRQRLPIKVDAFPVALINNNVPSVVTEVALQSPKDKSLTCALAALGL